MSEDRSTALLATPAIIRRVILGQMLFSAGHALTTGGFLNYFANPFFKGFVVWMAVMQIIPETAESLSVITRWLVLRWGGRKTVWWVSLVLGRLAALAIPGLVFYGMKPGDTGAMSAIIVLLGLWYLLQGVSFTAYLSWLSDLVPEVNWGRLMARRSMAISLVTLCMTYVAAVLLDRVRGLLVPERLPVYTLLFACGGLLCLASILPVVGLPRVAMRGTCEGENGRQGDGGLEDGVVVPSLWESIGPQLKWAFAEPAFRRFVWGSWQLSFFQGLTQTAQFQLSANLLHVSQYEYYQLLSVMLVLQIPLAAWAGRLVDQGHARRVMIWGLLGLSLAMGCWWMATWSVEEGASQSSISGIAWLLASYVLWGGFGLINVAQPSLGLKLAPRSDNAVQLSLFRQIGGLLAGLSGLLGGLVLDRFSQGAKLPPLEVFRWMFIVSGIGRATAALWFRGEEPPCDERVGSTVKIESEPTE
ncbi:MAG: hypothetical protein U0929_14840 [Planctomycetaceae bacterium]